MPLLSFWFVGALYVAWFFFTWVYFLLELFIFFICKHALEIAGTQTGLTGVLLAADLAAEEIVQGLSVLLLCACHITSCCFGSQSERRSIY
jgi:hypothetical protein